ncbi:hypothetical protein [Kribbella sp. DT2]|uniref:hypothetical protein n=1 Tax=Kribbella sp. DT2 TaxID=3393427 RepID=UPI003CE93042
MTIRHRDLATLRARATLEPYAAAWAKVASAPAGSPAVPAPIESQAILEGLVFQALRWLYYPQEDSRFDSADPGDDSHWGLPGVMEAVRIYPEADLLTVEIAPRARQSAVTLGMYLLPEIDEYGEWGQVGIPALRVRDIGDQLEFYRIGHRGAVRFRGVSAADFWDAHHWALDHSRGCIAARHPQAPSAVERERPEIFSPGQLRTTSSIVRHLGLLMDLGATGIDTWTNPRDRVIIEVELRSLTEAQCAKLIEDLCSPNLYLGLTLVKRPIPHLDGLLPCLVQLFDGSSRIDLRFTLSPPDEVPSEDWWRRPSRLP